MTKENCFGNGRGADKSSSEFVVVGGSLAGFRAIEAARREGYTGTITLFGQENHAPYDRPALSKKFLTERVDPPYYLSESQIRDDLGVDLQLGNPVSRLEPANHSIDVGTRRFQYEKLLIATGAAPRMLPHLPPIAGVSTLRTLEQAVAIRDALGPSSRVVVLGGGFIGSEIASSARSMGALVTIVESDTVPLVRAVGGVVGGVLAEMHARNGTRLLCDARVEEVLGSDRVKAVRLSTGEILDADVLVVGVGVAPDTAWLASSGIALDERDGGVVCDGFLQTSLPDVYAAGDVAYWPNRLMDAEMRLENWTNAAEQGARAAINALFPQKAVAYETVPFFWSDWYGNRLQFVGTAIADSVELFQQDSEGRKIVALYRKGNRLIAAFTLNGQNMIMKYRRLISRRGTWDEALELFAVSQSMKP